MKTYAVLANPGHNRVYFEQSGKLSAAELALAGRSVGDRWGDIRREELGGVSYIVFNADAGLDARELRILSRLSFVYAVFEKREDGSLLPLARERGGFADDSLGTILRYGGKTNELFTRLMINVALFSSDFHAEERTVLLDPVAGKGTTLFEGLILGHDVLGAEIVDKAVHEGVIYLKKYLENARYKHSYHKERISGESKSFTATSHSFRLARSKEEFRDDALCRDCTMVSGDSRWVSRFFGKNVAHMIVGDLPYGVAHGNVAGRRQTSTPTRSPRELLQVCLPAWREVLRPGGTLVLAWNTFVFPMEDMARTLEAAGFAVLREGPYMDFEHRVDQAIRRDVVVARRER